ncbi:MULTISPECIES: DUF2753 domain-containing protein [unclassified Pseudomonas]|uniref:DUF2753 domain-containing protein n=1 Tax=unclassified Pseudomonas TaxID=196821 RepID=UPI000BCBC920|nr:MULTISPECIES: DUF2753 domain-containing protein [unclassified Pseudomonas]PVZ12335.1 hypothetical protein F474_03130 [Pseudomonas sp. URIL14HWK12:I12]PVZ23513.1 hypothetical protein F470_03072 [Pseudomonas sp. URIL14HWK12:I10]PVZ32843.1 hypothetical protein F472_03420 [Pseudomonas sp. URIL14HWK12:I11]SNZ14239.1 hypothetical protein SAMN05660463_02769 [Pseudomonas sp. URIL14HWK12:I9]
MQHWRKTTEQANQRFEQGDLIEARELYLHALALAQVLFLRWPEADQAVAACVISHHNLADLHLRLGQPQESARYLCDIHRRLLQTAADPQLPAALRGAALQHSNRTYTELLGFIEAHGHYPPSRLLAALPDAAPQPAHTLKAEPSTYRYGVH